MPGVAERIVPLRVAGDLCFVVVFYFGVVFCW
jgi:hypothetical protein